MSTPPVQTLYRRPLPADAIAFSSSEGRRLFAEALAAGGLDAYFPLAEQFHTQADPAFCGLGSLVVALNALGVDPGRLWKGPWRWFAEDLLDCCVPLEEVRRRGLDLDELACLARCNGADVELRRADASSLADFRAVIGAPQTSPHVVVAAYDRRGLGQTGAGHFSPIAGYHAARDLATSKARGYMILRSRAGGVALGFTLSCANEGWPSLYARIHAAVDALGAAPDLTALARAIAPLTANVQLRVPHAPTHADALEEARRELRQLPAYASIAAAIGGEGADVATLLLCALRDRLSPGQRKLLEPSSSHGTALERDIETLHAQLSAITHLPRS